MGKNRHMSDFEADVIERVKDPEFAMYYLNELMSDRTPGAKGRLLLGLRRMAQSYGMLRLSKKIGRGRETLYVTLSEKGNPTLETFLAILDAFGIEPNFRLKPRSNLRARRRSAGRAKAS